ncbi:MAG TPA: glycosyltransferase, partial [Acidimicrobiales bacterium]|nr:glycosyltransferase [Acidimicrobiales bacterium]
VVGDHLPHAAAMAASLVANGGEAALRIHLLHDDSVSDADRTRLADWLAGLGVQLTCYRIDDARLEGLPTAGFTGKGSWYRVFLPDLLPEVDRLLYLDVDLLVLDSLAPLRAVDLGDAYLAAVTNVFEPAHLHRPAELGLAGPADYFNAGVLLMNLAALRRDGGAERLVDYGRRHAEQLAWRDQDALNVVLGAGRVPLPPRWNCMNSVIRFPQSVEVFGADAVREARRNPAIRHFEGPSLNKPWHHLADRADQVLYARYRAATPWPDVTIEDRTVATRLIRCLPQRLRTPTYVRLLSRRARREP